MKVASTLFAFVLAQQETQDPKSNSVTFYIALTAGLFFLFIVYQQLNKKQVYEEQLTISEVIKEDAKDGKLNDEEELIKKID